MGTTAAAVSSWRVADADSLRSPNHRNQPRLQFYPRTRKSRTFRPHFLRATASSSSLSTAPELLKLDVQEIKARYQKWNWNGYNINYVVFPAADTSASSSVENLLLVHGFGASIAHWRWNLLTLSSQSFTVYAIDLLGFGESDKPLDYQYTMESWAELILDFTDQVIQKPTILVGNSIGSLACVLAAATDRKSLVRGLVLLNCAGGMNNKAVVDDWRIKLLFPLLWLIDFLLRQRAIASYIFNRVKQSENLKSILSSVYVNKDFVDDELVEIIKGPAEDEGALDAFVSIITGPPGPNPVQLMPQLTIPVLVLWGDQDTLTPLDGPVGKYFTTVPSQLPNITLRVLEGVGHCPHDDRPELVHEKLLPWLASLP
ncbi:hypothetical protein QQ045_031872 [Rhodiola kirilowii]